MSLKKLLIVLMLAGAAALPATSANAFWGGGWMPWNWFDNGYYGYPGYWGGYPYGGYPGYWGDPYYGGYPGYWGGGYPYYGGGYPGYWGGYPYGGGWW